MGVGKTMTTAFVFDSLAKTDRLVCAYYCKDERELAKLETIYRSILLQLVNQSYEIKMRFYRWYKGESRTAGKDPTKLATSMSRLLYDIISSSQKLVFLVLDALDECEPRPRKKLLSLFQELLQSSAPLKVFVSSRYSQAIEADLPPGFARIEMRPSFGRDRTIATHLVKQTDISRSLQENVVERLAPMAGGSAIWLRIAVQYIEGTYTASSQGLEKALGQLSSLKGLVELYGRLFDKICRGIPATESQLQRALDILAIAMRPLTLQELTYAVFTVNPVDEDEDPTTLTGITELARSVNISVLVRPFVTEVGGGGGKRPHLRLAHQSLRELLFTAPPSEWCAAHAIVKRKKGDRAAEINADLLQRCIQYLLLEEFDEESISDAILDDGDSELIDFEHFLSRDEKDDAQIPTDTAAPDPSTSSDLSISVPAFGSFYAYAAANWTEHFSDVSPQRRPDPQQLIKLCSKYSRRMGNWVEQWQRANNRYLADIEHSEYLDDLDPLAITVMFGPPASVIDVLKLSLDSSILTNHSPWKAAVFLVEHGNTSLLRSFIQDEVLRPIFCSREFLQGTAELLKRPDAPDDAAKTGDWEEIFAFLIPYLRDEILTFANALLLKAARGGNIALVKQLFAAADKDATLRQTLLIPSAAGLRGTAPLLDLHQSIGAAASQGHADTVRFLCEQPGIEAHLHYVEPRSGNTVFHKAVGQPREAILRTLIQFWPEGVDIPRRDGRTPMSLLLGEGGSLYRRAIIPCVRILLHEGKANARARGEYSPLRSAVRGGHHDVLRVLVVEGGADVLEVVRIHKATKRPSLRAQLTTLFNLNSQDRMLRLLCSLRPLTVSVEHLGGNEDGGNEETQSSVLRMPGIISKS